jgi:hypothetical protein
VGVEGKVGEATGSGVTGTAVGGREVKVGEGSGIVSGVSSPAVADGSAPDPIAPVEVTSARAQLNAARVSAAIGMSILRECFRFIANA